MEARPSGLALALTALVVIAYLGLIVFDAVAPGAMAADTLGAVPLSFVLAFLLIVGVVAVTSLYVAAANRAEDRR